jgi:tetratricopeptide (TPR) repeat protein
MLKFIKRISHLQFLFLSVAVILLSTILLFQGKEGTIAYLIVCVLVIVLTVIRQVQSYQTPSLKDLDVDFDTFEDLDASIKKFPEEANYYYRRGVLNHDMCDYDDAMLDFNKAIELDANLSIALSARAILFIDDWEYEKAIHDSDKAIDIGFGTNMIGDTDVDLHMAYYHRGLAKNGFADYNGAINDFYEAIKENGGASNIEREGLAESYFKLGKYDEAISLYENAINYNLSISTELSNGFLFYKRGLCYFQADNLNKAREDWKVASSQGYTPADYLLNEHITKRSD